jgi:hypothetical protein
LPIDLSQCDQPRQVQKPKMRRVPDLDDPGIGQLVNDSADRFHGGLRIPG